MGKWYSKVNEALFVNLLAYLILALLGGLIPLLIPRVKSLSTEGQVGVASGSSVFLMVVFYFSFHRKRRPDVSHEPFVGAARELVMNINRVAQEAFQENSRIFSNSSHRFSMIEASYDIVGFDGYYTVLFQGQNVSRKPTRSIVRLVGGDSAIDTSVLRLEILPRRPTESLTWDFVRAEETPYRKPFRIFFSSPLKKRDEFAFEVRCCWPGTFSRKDDYVFFPIHHFRKGIDLLRLRVILGQHPVKYEGVVWVRGRYRVADTQPTLEPFGEGRWSIAVTVRKPKHLYAIWFTRKDI